MKFDSKFNPTIYKQIDVSVMLLKKLFFFIAIIGFSFAIPAKGGGLYLSAGPEYFIPQKNFDETNKACWGIKAEITGKKYCKLWYGLRFDYLFLKQKDDLTQMFYDQAFYLSPVIKWAPFTDNCYDNKFIPYLQGMLNLSIIDGNDDASQLGLGGALGLGVAYNFKLFERCWMLEADGIYSAPNAFYRDDIRNTMQSINFALTLSVAL